MSHRTKCYDSLLCELIQAGIRLLFSSCQEETADLLKELALVEQRKRVAIGVPTAVEGPRLEALRFYLSIPGVSYPTALALSHCFASVREMANRYGHHGRGGCSGRDLWGCFVPLFRLRLGCRLPPLLRNPVGVHWAKVV